VKGKKEKGQRKKEKGKKEKGKRKKEKGKRSKEKWENGRADFLSSAPVYREQGKFIFERINRSKQVPESAGMRN